MENISSKKLGHSDENGVKFAMEMLAGDITAGINFDRIQKHPKLGYIIFEYLLCKEEQLIKHGVHPANSHPRRYWNSQGAVFGNKRKFISMWEIAQKLEAKLFLVNYAEKGTKYEDEILLIEVIEMKPEGITKEKTTLMKRKEFSDYFRKLNKECLIK